jgi:hypothetical protein
MSNVVSPAKLAAALTEHWSPHTGNEVTGKTRSLAEQLDKLGRKAW